MSVANLVIFLIAVAGLALLVAQNLSPSLSLVFLGSQSPAFPLSFWIVMAIAVGVFLSLLIWGLFQLSGAGVAVSSGSPPPRSPKPPVQPTGFTREPTPEPKSSYSSSFGKSSSTASASTGSSSAASSGSTVSGNDDWETEVRPIPQSWDEEDWGLDDEEEQQSSYSTPSQTGWNQPETSSDREPPSEASEVRSSDHFESESSRRDHYEVEQKPQRESWTGSVYSYGYREGGDTGAGKSESVYDADYRIITPPPPPVTEIQQEESEQDWELEPEEDDTEVSSTDSSDSNDSSDRRPSSQL